MLAGEDSRAPLTPDRGCAANGRAASRSLAVAVLCTVFCSVWMGNYWKHIRPFYIPPTLARCSAWKVRSRSRGTVVSTLPIIVHRPPLPCHPPAPQHTVSPFRPSLLRFRPAMPTACLPVSAPPLMEIRPASGKTGGSSMQAD
ncbi:hypothetical protein BU26DRAFT_11618 [Trematosphaeria pertusa]|uniref:Uncharacterized protein n=1 Tax=Trematosphaeria pertusa TaxID=390896 RepID=A0A6A6IZN5_9PLEO|nr:uncharacterized protein BU26DRAFT_11618 [Trematosphaeria pertusa]KAF2255909.1 hypothetical protein BU26DRAFT_11618 [Trematosphaeria pertusa]